MMLAKPSPRDVAASVAKTAQHRQLEEQLAAINARHADRRKHQLALIHQDRERHGAEINALERELSTITAEMAPLRAQLADAKVAHGAAIAKALGPMRATAAAEIVDLVAKLRVVRNLIDETQVEIERAGGSATRMPPIGLNDIERRARKIAGIVEG